MPEEETVSFNKAVEAAIPDALSKLTDTLQEVAGDADVSVIVLVSIGRHTSLHENHATAEEAVEVLKTMAEHGEFLLNSEG